MEGEEAGALCLWITAIGTETEGAARHAPMCEGEEECVYSRCDIPFFSVRANLFFNSISLSTFLCIRVQSHFGLAVLPLK